MSVPQPAFWLHLKQSLSLLGAESFSVRTIRLPVMQEITWPVLEPKFSLQCPQNPIIYPCPNPDVSNPFLFIFKGVWISFRVKQSHHLSQIYRISLPKFRTNFSYLMLLSSSISSSKGNINLTATFQLSAINCAVYSAFHNSDGFIMAVGVGKLCQSLSLHPSQRKLRWQHNTITKDPSDMQQHCPVSAYFVTGVIHNTFSDSLFEDPNIRHTVV
jgi:hypothetical protein